MSGPHPAAHAAIQDFFDGRGWAVDEPGDGPWQFPVRGDNGEWFIQIWWLDEVDQLLIYSLIPFLIREGLRDDLVAWANEVNRQLSVGNFEIDPDDGAMRCRTAVAVAPDDLTPDLIDRAFTLNTEVTDRFLPDLVRLTLT